MDRFGPAVFAGDCLGMWRKFASCWGWQHDCRRILYAAARAPVEGRKMKKAPTPSTASGAFKEQIPLIPELGFSPIWPSHTTIAGRVLAEFLRGEWLDHEDVITGCRSWRLAAYVKELKNKGWPVQSFEKPQPWPTCHSRAIAVYGLPPAIIEQVQSLRGAA
jgi:hypothetical protein